ncbi:beta-galactosidase [Cellulomonas endophytica]|uniref:beta-galactosidase n=1 Tax=Cellulomonas endophytica TaxID=2494735 RepID=UPI001F0C1830|nr:beta-galactosidase [Cellulomonas endophytica]
MQQRTAPGGAPAPLAALTSELGVLYGGDWSPEQWDPAVWPEDVALMREAGVNLVTVGVFAWSSMEPEEGRLELGWLDTVLDHLHAGGVAVDLATPTASPPPWLAHRYPTSSAVDRSGVRMAVGSRNHFCPSSPDYRRAARGIAGALVERYGSHPAVRMWHIGNEFGQVCFCDLCADGFRRWLQVRHGSLDALNAAWGTAFWSQRYADWQEIVPPRVAPYIRNPGQSLDHRRFASDLLLGLYREQRDLVRAAAPGVPVTTNLMGFHPHTDDARWAPELDVVSEDHYPDPADPDGHLLQALQDDLARGIGGGRPWVQMEQAAGGVNWRPHNVPKTPARMRLDSLRAVARGSDASLFFQWRQSLAGAEKWHSALLPAAGPDTRLHRAVRAHGAELRRLRPVVGARVPAEVALVFDWSSWWAAQEPAAPSDRLDVLDLLREWYRPLHAANVTADVVPPWADLTPYRLVLAPQLHLVEDADVPGLRAVVERGDVLVLGPWSAALDGHGRLRPGRFPAPFTDLVGGSGEEYVPLAAPVAVEGVLGAHRVGDWAERLRTDGGEALLVARGGDLDGVPLVVTRRHASGGTGVYAGALLPPAATGALVAHAVAAAGVAPAAAGLPAGVEAVRRGPVLFLLNTTGGPVPLDGLGGRRDLLTDAVLGRRQVLEPDGVLALATSDAAGAGPGTAGPLDG